MQHDTEQAEERLVKAVTSCKETSSLTGDWGIPEFECVMCGMRDRLDTNKNS